MAKDKTSSLSSSEEHAGHMASDKKTGKERTDPADDEGASGDVSQRSELEHLKQELAKKSKQLEETETKLKYVLADYDNLVKRSARDRDQNKLQAAESLMKNLLGFLDNFEQAVTTAKTVLQQQQPPPEHPHPDQHPVQDQDQYLQPGQKTEHAPAARSVSSQLLFGSGGSSKTIQGMAQGIIKLYQSLMQILAAEGLEMIPSVGLPFDLSIHEAVLTQETDEHPENTVLAEVQKGYWLHHRVLRPAKVIVSITKSKPKPKPKSKSKSNNRSRSNTKDGKKAIK